MRNSAWLTDLKQATEADGVRSLRNAYCRADQMSTARPAVRGCKTLPVGRAGIVLLAGALCCGRGQAAVPDALG